MNLSKRKLDKMLVDLKEKIDQKAFEDLSGLVNIYYQLDKLIISTAGSKDKQAMIMNFRAKASIKSTRSRILTLLSQYQNNF